MKYYVAYGSNLSEKQMAQRCPDAKVVGKASLPGYKLVFRRYATIEPSPEHTVPVLIWKISEQDEKNLDYYEGYPDLYEKKELPLAVTDSKENCIRKMTALAYIMTDYYPACPPSKAYYHTIETAYDAFGFDKSGLQKAKEEAEELSRRDI